MLDKIDYPDSARAAINSLPPCIQEFFRGKINKDSFGSNIDKACKVALLAIRTQFGDLDGDTFKGMIRILAQRQGITKRRLTELAKDLNPKVNFSCNLIQDHSDLHSDDCKYNPNGTVLLRLIDVEPTDHKSKAMELTWNELTVTTIPREIMVYCEYCTSEEEVTLENEQSIKLVGGQNRKEERDFLIKELGKSTCPCGKKKLRITPSKFQDVIVLMVKDLDINIASFEHEVEQIFPCYIFFKDKNEQREKLRQIESANKIKMDAKMIVKNTQQNVAQKMFECVKIHETDKRFSYTVVTEEMRKSFRAKLGGTYEENLRLLHHSFAGWIGGRDFEKEIALMWCFSDPNDPVLLAVCGDSRVGKSDILLSVLSYSNTFESIEDSKAGDCDVVFQGENMKRTAFYLHRREPTGDFKLIKGRALRAQGGRLFIDSVTQCNQDVLSITREAIPQKKMIIAGAGTMGQTREIDFVTRYAISYNLEQEFNRYASRYVAWKDGFPDVFSYYDLKRFSLVVPFAQTDVLPAVMRDAYESYDKTLRVGLSPEEFKMLKIFCDGLEPESYLWEDGVSELLLDLIFGRWSRDWPLSISR
jgi:hypothetical protein